ncbi:MAG: inorganic phosphate transporter [Verrucomicrobia bacterium]|nr:inorganic phosphate transporter [Verrucomicrobiota bacterium]MBS0636473.1 inorganic phosphate transporter [Verrucomicrobiota bacterium]
MIDYQPILIISLLFGFYAAWNIGANDVSNAMGTSVGSKALTIRQAVIVAAIFEFCGAVFFGSHVSETLQQGIINPHIFANNPEILVNGMLASLLACGIWLQLATYFGLPVSTTHAIVGAIVGFGAVVGGTGAIYWDEVLSIAGSWVVSPLMGAAVGFVFFSILRKRIFYSNHPLESTKKALPWIAASMVMVFMFVGLSHTIEKLQLILLTGAAVGLCTKLICRKVKTPIHDSMHEEFTYVERIFAVLQVCTACLMAFSHGANDVANAIGPLAAIISITETNSTVFQATIPTWILILGGAGIVAGLATWGWRVIETIGRKITELTPSRGFSAEFAAALTVLLASRLGFPISTTHTLVGAVLGVGLAGGIAALNLRMIRDIALAWIVTIPAGAALSISCYYLISLFT